MSDKAHPDVNDTLREQGPDAVRERHDRAHQRDRSKAKPNGPSDHRAPGLTRLDLAPYDTEPIPAREWGVLDRFPRRNVALLSGHGGVGKSITLLQLAVAHVMTADWLRSLPEHGPVVLVNCEDEGAELVRRLQPIVSHYGTTYSAIARDLHIFPLIEMSDSTTGPLLARLHNGVLRPTALYENLIAIAREIRPICIMIDNVADVFGGSEIDRVQVRQFVSLIRRAAIAANGYVLLSAHPSVAGIANKSGLSGSTQWHNRVRARAYLRGPSGPEKDSEVLSSSIRILEFMKSNYSALAEQIQLQWANGVYLPVPSPSAPEAAAAQAAAEAIFLDQLDKATREGANVSGSPAANNYAPRVFAKTKEASQAGISERSFADALSRLIEADQVRAEPYGPPAKAMRRLARRRLL
jgi:RecA-family ATPase